ncbi:MAG: hypothetical protein JXR05_17000 [Flavobacteriaceae bacterium]
MKKLFIAFCAMFFVVSVVSATDGTDKTLPKKKSIVKIEKNEIIKKAESEKTFCSVSCTMTHNGITYSTTAGNWFSTCEGAARRCEKKLRQYVQDAEVEIQ